MITQIFTIIQQAIGLNELQLMELLYTLIRGIIVYLFGMVFARFNKKFIGIRTSFNFVLFVLMGSIFATAIIDAKVFLSTLATISLLLIINGLLSALAYRFPSFELFAKGSPTTLVKNGKIQWNAMKKNFITERELYNELHAQIHSRNLQDIEEAILASDGTIHFIKKQ